MSDYKTLETRLASKEVVILDGAVGTQLQKMGVPMNSHAWAATAPQTHPYTVRLLHENYIRAGGNKSFSEYYTAKYDGALFSPTLTRNVVFSQHNLVTDRSFSEFNVIFCRNVLIYFDRELQDRVHALFYESLSMFGVLALGSKETLRFSKYEPCYEKLHAREKMYRKVK